MERATGIILHPTSLPGSGGIGTLGSEARGFLDVLAGAGIGLWQVLPLGPTGYGDAPYSALSAFGGNPLLIDLEPLIAAGWLQRDDLAPLSNLPETRVDFGRLVPIKMDILRKSYHCFSSSGQNTDELDAFVASSAGWVADLALFLALKGAHGGRSWVDWEPEYRRRDTSALSAARVSLASDIGFETYLQWLFFGQWDDVRAYANERGIGVIGDIPIFVAHDSADVWAHQELFLLDDDGRPSVLAGVPPDYFSPTGQLWGNPHYRWSEHERTGFQWWIHRFESLARLVDVVRLDHFRGFAGAWQVPRGDRTAERGEWVDAPGAILFNAMRSRLPDLPIIAEDLGVITPDVVRLRREFGFPGMHILQFAFGTGAGDPNLPHNLQANSVVYTGTHDNDTTAGWFSGISLAERRTVLDYTGSTGLDIAWDLIRLAIASVAETAIAPLQDVLRLGAAARMNFPGRPEGNWAWRFTGGSISAEDIRGLRALNETYGRRQFGRRIDSAVR